MSPDDIRAFLSHAYPQLIAEPRSNPDGWSFFLAPAQRGANSNRILRAVRHNPHGVTRLKLAVSSRADAEEHEIDFSGSSDNLSKLVDAELRLFDELKSRG